jgi:hypothetical protein
MQTKVVVTLRVRKIWDSYSKGSSLGGGERGAEAAINKRSDWVLSVTRYLQ